MNKDKLEQVEQVLDKIRDSFLFPRPEMNSTLEKKILEICLMLAIHFSIRQRNSSLKLKS